MTFPLRSRFITLLNDVVARLVARLDVAVSTRAAAGDAMTLTPAERLVVQALILSDATPFLGARIDATITSRAAPGAAMALTPAERLIVQALVLSDATPFAGANIATILARVDVATSTRAAPGAAMALTPAERLLVQALVLSDATPFLGARIDATISSRAATGAAMALTAAERLTVQALVINDVTPFAGANIALMKTQTDKIPNVEHTAPYSSGVARNDIAAVGPTNTTAVSITPTFPTGATKVRVIAVVDLFIENDTANAQKITATLAVQLNGAGYNNRWTPGGDIVAVPATDGTSASIRAVVTITADIVTAQQTDFRWAITQSSANSVHYTSQATIFLVYHM